MPNAFSRFECGLAHSNDLLNLSFGAIFAKREKKKKPFSYKIPREENKGINLHLFLGCIGGGC